MYVHVYTHARTQKYTHARTQTHTDLHTDVWTKRTFACMISHVYILHTQRPILTPRRTTLGLLAASGYASSSTATTSGQACFATAWCSGSWPDCTRVGQEHHQHPSRQAGRLSTAPSFAGGAAHVYFSIICLMWMPAYTHTHVYAHKATHTHTYICKFMHAHTHIHMHKYTRTQANTY